MHQTMHELTVGVDNTLATENTIEPPAELDRHAAGGGWAAEEAAEIGPYTELSPSAQPTAAGLPLKVLPEAENPDAAANTAEEFSADSVPWCCRAPVPLWREVVRVTRATSQAAPADQGSAV